MLSLQATGVCIIVTSLLKATVSMGAGIHANYNCNNAISVYHGEPITSVVFNYAEGSYPTLDGTAEACCQNCQNTPGCAYSQFANGAGCTLTLAGGQGCNKVGYFVTSTNTDFDLTIANGTCGTIVPKVISPSPLSTKSASVRSVSNDPTNLPGVNANCDNGVSSYEGQAVTTVQADVEGTIPNGAATPLECCAACQNERGCQYAQFTTGQGCMLALASGQCSAGSFYMNSTAPVSMIVYNGTCGGVVFGGEAK